MITFFSTPQPFTGVYLKKQRNAVISWKRSCPSGEIILLGREQGIKEACQQLGAVHIPEIEYSESGRPMMDSAFELATQKAKHKIMCWITADVVLLVNFLELMKLIPFEQFSLIGQRIDYSPEIDIDKIDLKRIRQEGALHLPWGIDYHVFIRGFYQKIPPFIIGRCRWDNWLVWEALQRRIPVIDCTKAILCVHQDHPNWYARLTSPLDWKEARHNESFVPEPKTISDASYRIEDGEVIKNHGFLLNQYEKKIYSQNDEDGIIMEIFRKIGTKSKTLVEIAPGDGTECMAKNLLVNFGWNGLLADRQERAAKGAEYHYKHLLKERSSEVKVVQSWVTMGNVNKLLVNNGIMGEIDLLSIDVDGNDWWLWWALRAINPRVVVIEYNASFGYEEAFTVEYDLYFDRGKKHPSYRYHGASLLALTKLAKLKGYVLVGCESHGINAFFVRKDVARQGGLPEIPVEKAYFPHAYRREMTLSEVFKELKGMDFVYV